MSPDDIAFLLLMLIGSILVVLLIGLLVGVPAFFALEVLAHA